MSANINARFTIAGDVGSDASTGMAPTFTTAAADYDGTTATHNKVVFTADATNGSRIAGLNFRSKGTNIATVARIFTNNGSSAGTATNNSLIDEVSLPATTASATVATTPVVYFFPGNYIDLPAAYKIIVGLGTTVSAGWVVTPVMGGKF